MSQYCDRCGTDFDDLYCPQCRSCQHCGCCPCYRVGCEWCPEGGVRQGEAWEAYSARRAAAWAEYDAS